MTGEVARLVVGGVGVRVDVDEPDAAVTEVVGDRRGRRPGDRVVSPEYDGDDPARRDGTDAVVDRLPRRLPQTPRARGVAVVDDVEVVEDLELQVEVVGARRVRIAQRARAEAGAGAVRRAAVPRSADDSCVGLPLVELLGLGEERAVAEGAKASAVEAFELFAHAGRESVVHHGAHLRPWSCSPAPSDRVG